MAPQDTVGRIHKVALVASTSTIFGLTLLAVLFRLYFRIIIQRTFALDDGILLFGLLLLISAFAILYIEVIDLMYIFVALQSGDPSVLKFTAVYENVFHTAYAFQKWVTVTLVLSGFTVMAAKLSFLAFFWKLIDRMPRMKVYWWFALVANLGINGWCVAVYFLGCPYFNDPRAFSCFYGAGKKRLIALSIAQITSDIVSDLLILVIPVTIVWKVRVRPAQKLALLCSLGLTVFMIIITIARVAGMMYKAQFDLLWEVYWLFLAAEVGICMAAALTFRSFFVTRSQGKAGMLKGERLSSFGFMRRFLRRRSVLLDSRDDERRLPVMQGGELIGMQTFLDTHGRRPDRGRGHHWERSPEMCGVGGLAYPSPVAREI